MAMYSAVPPPPELAADPAPASPLSALRSQANQPSTGVDIDAWTISALQSLSVSPVARGTGTPLAIAIDSEHPKRSVGVHPRGNTHRGTQEAPLAEGQHEEERRRAEGK